MTGISQDVRDFLVGYDWPGNVRELENAIERAVVLGTTEVILPEDLPEAILERELSPSTSSTWKYHEAVTQTKKQIILDAMEKVNGNYTEAARLLGVHPNYLHRFPATKHQGPDSALSKALHLDLLQKGEMRYGR